MDWWDVARWTSDLAISELEIDAILLDRLQVRTRDLMAQVPTDRAIEQRLPRESHLLVASYLAGSARFECTCRCERSGHRLGTRLVPPDRLHPLDARWASRRGWAISRGVAVPWIHDADGRWQDPNSEDVLELLSAMRWGLYQRHVQMSHRQQVA
jgi:hypothetical protein